MTVKKKYIDKDVYTAAKERINYIIDSFDTVMVCFSGGKDSLVTLSLVEEVYKERGITDKIKVVFRDEELIPDDVINFVIEKYNSGKYDFRYYAIPLLSHKYILGKTEEYIQWDSKRKWLRQPPDFAIKLEPGDNRVFSQFDADGFICQNEPGKVALLVGIRAQESLMRTRGILSKRNLPFIAATETDKVNLCKPIYDWTEDDVFLYFYKTGIKYCPIYDAEMLNGQMLRVATPLHAENAKRIGKLRTLYPVFYQQLVDIFPEVLIQDKYFDEYDRTGIIMKYEHSWKGIRDYIMDEVGESEKPLAWKRVCACRSLRKNLLARGEHKDNLGGYPILYVFKTILAGSFKHSIMPKNKASLQDFTYEGFTEKEYREAQGDNV